MKRKRIVKVLWTFILIIGTLSMVFFTMLPMFGIGN
jgi:hypothetical protein